MYLSVFFAYIGIGLISNSWIFLIITFVDIIIIILFVKYEEKFCLEKYGEEYKNYMKKTPRWIGFKKY
jgi:protein-S-isoprenylcysteine O-methyltransferase Ste14